MPLSSVDPGGQNDTQQEKKVKECIVLNSVKNLGSDFRCRSTDPCREACGMSFFIALH